MKLEEGLAARVKVPNGKRDVLIFDTEQAGLFLRVFETGKAIYGVRYEVAGRQRQKHLREVVSGVKGLAAARKEAADVRAMARLGTDLVADARAQKVEAAAQGKTIAKLMRDFLADHKEKWRPVYYRTVEMHLTKHLKPVADMPLKAVRRQDVVEALNKVESTRGKIAADRARASLSTFYTWAIDRGHTDATPVVRIKARGETGGRDRTLTLQEVVDVWRASDYRGDDYGRIVKLLILTGQRRDEIGLLGWTEVNLTDKRIELPGGKGAAGRTKNHRPHVVPLSALALAQLPAQPDLSDPLARTRVFGRRHHTGFSGWGKAKEELDAAIAAARKRRGIGNSMPPWVLHDLRRTFVTHLGELGIAQPHVIEAIVNHISGHKAGVAGIYNRALYLDERVKALDAWAQYIEGLVRA